ncbi:acyl-synthetase [Grosmannia clavigera kw1407]|uniref:Acyl-synthetase n=1 Tax=Grosmannia clavigera (strain kw1407 / UAMH 11150) TaxID=655863 RepID=F0XFA8_GROCL|nr:acyl-synthetase [Grosmannia clavigera kw1407]EFX04197.1 acyl-synthetase [Grosmannia clavigera kw1407]
MCERCGKDAGNFQRRASCARDINTATSRYSDITTSRARHHVGDSSAIPSMEHPQDTAQRRALADPEAFWGHQAAQLQWHRQPDVALQRTTKTLADGTGHEHWAWFPGGQISTCHNCVDRHVQAGRGDEPAILYDSPVTQTKQRLTYGQLLAEVETTAAVLREHGVGRGDVVLVYMPMIPATLIGILAVNRLGAVHTVVFGGFAAAALAQRIEDARPVAVLTASCGVDGNKPPMAYRPLVEAAIAASPWKPPHVLVWQRDQLSAWDLQQPLTTTATTTVCWQTLVQDARRRRVTAACVPVASTDPVYIIYTSGTTGRPKGVVREAGGHAVGLHLSISYLFNIHGPGDVMACFSDIGWVVSHSYTLYAPLLAGAATVLYEGKPVGTPDAGAFWRMIEEYHVTTMFTAPTALRAIRKEDPDNGQLAAVGGRGGLRSLRALFLAGERSEPTLVTMYQQLLARYGAPGAQVVDNWWSSESGSPISGIALGAHVGLDSSAAAAFQTATSGKGSSSQLLPPLAVRPGSAGKPMPGFDVRVVDDVGAELPPGAMGNIVLRMPLAPTAFCTLWQDDDRFYRGYLRRFQGRWLDTGDAGIIDKDGYISIMARSDDIINVAAHRLSTGALEQAVTSHPLVAEACVVSIPDALKGHMPFAFVNTNRSAASPTDEALFRDINGRVRAQVGPIASLGGLIEGSGMIPRTRSGKTLRRVLRELLENAVHGDFDAPVAVPSTIEDPAVIDVARERVRTYFRDHAGDRHAPIETRPKL